MDEVIFQTYPRLCPNRPLNLLAIGSVEKSLNDTIERLGGTKAMLITGQSLSNKTTVIRDIEKLLGSGHVLTFDKVGQHAYVTLL